MMARICESCNKLIEQKDDEYLEVTLRILDSTEGAGEDAKGQAYGDFCDACVSDGSAVRILVKRIDWNL